MTSPLEDAARSYISAYRECEESDGPSFLAARIEVDERLHDLTLAAGFDCRTCDVGTCPGLIATVAVDSRLSAEPPPSGPAKAGSDGGGSLVRAEFPYEASADG